MLELHDAGFGYTDDSWVFRHVSLTVPAGSLTAVLGPNGKGKTTLARCAAGLLDPREGEVRRQGPAGFVPQTRGNAFAYTALEMVVMGRLRQVGLFATPRGADVAAARAAMERTGVADLGERRFPTLSGGEQQLVLIARALATESPLLVLDEPSAGLDLHNQSRILMLLRRLVGDGLSVLMTTHHPDQALFAADTVALMDGGAVTAGPVEEMLSDERLSRLYSIDIRTLRFEHDGVPHRAIATLYGSDTSPSGPDRSGSPDDGVQNGQFMEQ